MTIIIDGTVGANKGVVLDSNGKLPVIDGSQVTTLSATQITTGTVATARLDTGTTAGKVLVLDGSGNMPAVDGSLMSGIVSATKSASNPTVSTNPATGLGTKWINTTTGDVYVLTDATAGENVWTNSGAGSGDITSWNNMAGGTQYGWSMGGDTVNTDRIEKWSYTSDGNATDIANLTVDLEYAAGHSSATHGYTSGGISGGTNQTMINKFAFASTVNATNIGDRTVTGYGAGGCYSDTHGYTAGSTESPFGTHGNRIDRFSFSSDGDSTDVGNLSQAGSYAMDCTQSATYGYRVGGAWPAINVIDRWQFASSADATDVGNLLELCHWPSASHSATHGYCAGGHDGTNKLNRIQKFLLASSADATDVGNLTSSTHGPGGTTSSTYGYAHGGTASSGNNNIINKYAYASDGDATDVGNLTESKRDAAGAEY